PGAVVPAALGGGDVWGGRFQQGNEPAVPHPQDCVSGDECQTDGGVPWTRLNGVTAWEREHLARPRWRLRQTARTGDMATLGSSYVVPGAGAPVRARCSRSQIRLGSVGGRCPWRCIADQNGKAVKSRATRGVVLRVR